MFLERFAFQLGCPYLLYRFLLHSCHQKVEKRVHTELVENHLSVIQGEASKLVSAERTTDLSNMYQLLRPVPGGLKPLVACVQEHIKQRGLAAVHQLQGDNVRGQPLSVYLRRSHTRKQQKVTFFC